MNLRDELQKIYDDHRRLTAKLVVEVATPKSHPLHSLVFDRSEKEAAWSWYEHRAQELIRSVKIKYRRGELAETTRAFVSVQREDGRAYYPSEVVAQDEILTELVLRDMEREWRQLQSRYGHFKEFIDLVRQDTEAA